MSSAVQSFLLDGGPILWALVALGVWLGSVLILRTLVLHQVRKKGMSWSGDHQALRQFRRTIRLLTVTAPMLGLLGTVAGMIRTFEAVGGPSESEGVASGIAEALTTTEMGLVVALPGLFWGYWLEQQEIRLHKALEARRSGRSEGVAGARGQP